MYLDITIYSTREKKITLDEFKDELIDFFPLIQIMSDSEPTASTTRWFISVPPKPINKDDTMHDAEMLVLDVTNDEVLANKSAKMLLFDLAAAEKDADTEKIIDSLKNAKQSFYASVKLEKSETVTKLVIVLSAAILKLGVGVLHEAENDEFFNADNFKTFVERNADEDSEKIIEFFKKL